jgi:nucleoside-diphosphate-sugar epimerase
MQKFHTPSSPPDARQVDEELSEPSEAMVEAAHGLAAPVAVLGAGGKMGLHVARMARLALDRAGRPEAPVVAVSRFSSLRARDEFESRGISAVAADLLDEGALTGLPDFGTVYFLAGMKFGSAEQPETLRLFNEVMPARVAERYRQSVIVALSTGCVYSFVSPESGGSRETDPADPRGDYAVSCHGREKAFSEASLRNGTPVALIRLNYSVEYRYGVLVDIAQKVMEGTPIDVTMGYVNVIWQRDAVEHVLRAEAVAASPPAVLNIAGQPIISVRELAEKFGRRFDRVPIVTGSEEPTAWLNDGSRAHGLFGAPQVDLDEMIARVAAWLSAGGGTHGKPTKFEVRDGKF